MMRTPAASQMLRPRRFYGLHASAQSSQGPPWSCAGPTESADSPYERHSLGQCPATIGNAPARIRHPGATGSPRRALIDPGGMSVTGHHRGTMRVVLAEKPSVARELAAFLGAGSQRTALSVHPYAGKSRTGLASGLYGGFVMSVGPTYLLVWPQRRSLSSVS
jgi:hypothetical protein